jgi:hypothetical protein
MRDAHDRPDISERQLAVTMQNTGGPTCCDGCIVGGLSGGPSRRPCRFHQRIGRLDPGDIVVEVVPTIDEARVKSR